MNWLLYLPAIASPIAVAAVYFGLKASRAQRPAVAATAPTSPKVTPEEVRPVMRERPLGSDYVVESGEEVQGTVPAHIEYTH